MSGMGDSWRQLLGIAISAISIFWANYTLAQSKITPDNTLGAEKSNVIPNYGGLPIEVISNGAIRGQNLFHSFREFNVSEGRGAYFFSPSAAIQNIVARVTGSNRSEILGILGTFGNSNPNLFLINPNGIIFGPNASLDVGNSFVATTANAIQFGSIGTFSASNPETSLPLLTINPTALLFNQIAAEGILNQSTQGLAVPNGKSLSLVGGNVILNGGALSAPSGQIELGGLTGTGTVGLEFNNNNLALSYPDGVARGDVLLTNGSQVDIIGGDNGSITVNAHNLDITGGSTLITAIGSNLGILGSRAGNININATDTVTIDGRSSTSAIINGALGNGNAGDTLIKTGSLNLINAEIASFTNAQGNAGNVTIQATNAVSISGTNSGIISAVGPLGVGNGADVSIQARSLSLSAGAQVSSSTLGRGDAGNIQINVADGISVNRGSLVRADTFGQGNAGNIKINAGSAVSLDGIGSNGVQSEIITFVGTAPGGVGRGKGGDINISANSILVTNTAQINAGSYGQGNAGNIAITARSIGLDQGFIEAETNSGNGGNITLTPQDFLLLRNGSAISTSAGTLSAGGDGGNITINVPSGFIVAVPNENSDITANAFSGQGGKVTINATNIYGIAPLNRQDLERLRPQDLDQRQLPTNDVTAVSQQSPDLNGTVQINTPEVDPSRGLVTLPTVTEVAPRLVSPSCAAFNEIEGGSQFTITGRSGLPPSPDEPLTSDVVWTDARLRVTTTQQHKPKTLASLPKPKPIAIIPATGWVLNDKGEVTLISKVTNATSSNTPTSCPTR